MSILLRIEMIILSIFFLCIVFRTVVRKKLQVQYALIWFVLAIGTFLLAVIPGAAEFLSGLVGIKTPSNFIYLLAILALLALTFSLTIIVSKQALKLKKIIQLVSVEETLEKEIANKNAQEQKFEKDIK